MLCRFGLPHDSEANKDNKKFPSSFAVKAFFLNTSEVTSTLREKTGLEESTTSTLLLEQSEKSATQTEEDGLDARLQIRLSANFNVDRCSSPED